MVSYGGLLAWDAVGKMLPVEFVAGSDPTELGIEVDVADARYPVTIDPLAQQAYLKASNTAANDEFGISVSVSGDTVVVGAPGEDSNTSVINGNAGNNNATSAGAAYVFVRNGAGWIQQAYLKASNTGADDRFGISVAISGNTIVVGANGESSGSNFINGNAADDSALAAGAAYVFARSGELWSQQAYLKAANSETVDNFGANVAVSGDTVLVSATGEDSNATVVNGDAADNNAFFAGAVYVFVRDGTAWTQQAYLKAANAEASDQFGSSLGISGNTVVIGAVGEDSDATGVNGDAANNATSGFGAAYVFVRNGTVWTQQAYLKGAEAYLNVLFGFSVAVSGETIVVGAIGDDSGATGINGDASDGSAQGSGAAYVFVRNGTSWTQQAYLKASNTEAFDSFGRSVAVSGETVVVAATGEDSSATGINGNATDNGALSSGAAYVFRRSGTTWAQLAYLKAANTGADDNFGRSVSVSGGTVLVGAEGEASNASGVNGNEGNNSAVNAGAAYVLVFPAPVSAPTIEAKGRVRRTTTRARITLRGTSTGATRVEFKGVRGSFRKAKGPAARWRVPVRLEKNRTVVRVRDDGPGGRSPVLRFVVTRQP